MQEWDRVMRIDLRGTYLCCAAFGTRMAERGSGAIVNIASVSGMRSGPLHLYEIAENIELEIDCNDARHFVPQRCANRNHRRTDRPDRC